jgi:sec-independent protein translocase protein TatA
MPFGLQPWHIIAVVVVALIIFGPKRLPEIGRGIGKALNEFRQGTKEMTDSFRDEMRSAEPAQAPVQSIAQPVQPQAFVPPTPAPQLEGGNFCVHCGAPNPAEAKFCNKCGSQLPSPQVKIEQ